MARAQKHRGPDGHGYALWGDEREGRSPFLWRGDNHLVPSAPVPSIRLGLAHNWLAIQDTRSIARQPLSWAERYWIVFSGEIYNFIELRQALVAGGAHFLTTSDTEVLLALWHQEGPRALDQLRGMFAFVLYDAQEDVLWAARDRFGVKPLYWARLPENSGVLLASEFRGLHASGLVARAWNDAAVRAFLAAGVNKPDDTETFFREVNEVPPGSVLEIHPGELDTRRYYTLAAPVPELGSEALPELRERFMETIAWHLRSVREVGTCLSGGLDSANVACAIRRLLGAEVSRFKAFTIGSLDAEDIQLACRAAQAMGLEHYTIPSPATLAFSDLVDMVVACETPNHTWGPINQYLLLRYIAAEHGLAVLLDGQGGDEVFSGYPWFFALIDQFVRERVGVDAADALGTAYRSKPPLPSPALKTSQRMYLDRRQWIEAFDGGACAALGVSTDEVLQWAPVNYYLNDALDWASFREREIYRRELQHLLRQEDRLGMWFSIENRVPFLDHTLVELAVRLDPRFLVGEGYLKYPLRLLFPELPEALRFRTRKTGFWENYSQLPCFDDLAREVLGDAEFIVDKPRVRELDRMALWRFFQIHLLSQVSARDEAAAWAKDRWGERNERAH